MSPFVEKLKMQFVVNKSHVPALCSPGAFKDDSSGPPKTDIFTSSADFSEIRRNWLFSSFEWLLGWNTQLALVIAYTKAVELLVICYFYLDVASKMMHWSSKAGKRLCFSSLFMMFTYFTLFLVMGLLLSVEPWADCHGKISPEPPKTLLPAPYWIWFSAGEFLIVQLTVGSFFLILKRMSRISASPAIQRNQKIDLFR